MDEYENYMERRLQAVRNLSEKIEFHLFENEYYLTKECENYIECGDRYMDTPHEVYSIYPLDEGRFFLHRFENSGESYSSLCEGNYNEILLCKRKYEMAMVEYFHRNQEMILTKSTEENKNTDEDEWDIGNKNIEENDLWQPEI